MPSIPSNATPRMLKWARQSIGLKPEDVATAEKVSVDLVLDWEKGTSTPTLAMLRKLEKRYKRPLMVFYLPEPPQEFTVVKDFRKLPSASEDLSPTLRYAIRRAQERQSWASDYLSEIGALPSDIVGALKTTDDVSEAARDFRARLQITVAQQEECERPLDGFRLWRSVLEEAGIFVFQAINVEVKEMRGFALSDRFAPVAVVNSADADVAKIFTLLHEVAHLLLGVTALTGGAGDFDVSPTSSIEKFCNRFAGEVLVPRDDFIRRIPANWQANENEVLRQAAKVYCVSRPVIGYRLVECGLAPKSWLFSKWSAIQTPPREKAGGGRPQHEIAIGRSGPAFVALALSAYHGNNIHGGALSELLKMNLKHLPKLEGQIYPNRALSDLGA